MAWEYEKLAQKMGLKVEFKAWNRESFMRSSEGWHFNGAGEYRVAPEQDESAVRAAFVAAKVAEFEAAKEKTFNAALPAAVPPKHEKPRAPLQWAQPAVWDPFPDYVVVSGNEPYTAAGPAGAFGKSAGADDFGRTTFVNPLLRG